MIKNRKKLLFVFGTRPEAIKMAPLIQDAKNYPKDFEVIICVTGQHKEMLDQVLDFFKIQPDFNLNLMRPNQDISEVTSFGLAALKIVMQKVQPDIVLVQGDTTSAFIGALAGFYQKCKVAHIEAGLRSGDKQSPYPEETYRTLVGHMADYHFAPTDLSKKNINKENIKNHVYVVGNTVIDALFLGLNLIKNSDESSYMRHFNFLDFNKKIILITGHRRESFGKPMQDTCTAFKMLAVKYPDVQFVYPVHLNPNVQEIVKHMLSGIKNFFLIDPLEYPYIIWLMEKSYLIITDSGGIQEEAPSLGKPVLVTRDVTERVEGIDAGTAKLVGTNTEKIITETQKLLEDSDYYKSMSTAVNPYGDGKSSKYIIDVLSKVS